MNIKIYTTEPITWFEKEAKEVEKAYSSVFPITFTFERIPEPKPVFAIDSKGDKVIDWIWFCEQFKDKGAGFHFNKKLAKKWGITLGGQRNSNSKEFPQFWIAASKEKAEGYDFSNFRRILFHEPAHFWEDQDDATGDKLVQSSVHNMDYKLKAIHKYHLLVDFEAYKMRLLEDKKTYLEKLIASLKASLVKKDVLQPLVERKAQEIVKEMALLGLPVRITEGFRSVARQNELYAQGRTTKGNIVTNAKGGESFHNYGVAVDFVFTKTGYNAPESHWKTLGTIAKKHGFTWGGDWKGFVDKPHVEMLLGYTLKDFQLNKVDYNKYI